LREGSSYQMERRPGYANDTGDVSAFYAEISSIQEDIRAFYGQVTEIGQLHSKSLSSVEDKQRQDEQHLASLTEDTRSLSNNLKLRIKELERRHGNDSRLKQQIGLVKSKFIEAIQHYQTVEKEFRQKYKQRVERQLRIVKPDATSEEISAASVADTQIFQQALMSSNRYGESRAAFREAQERNEDIKRIEKTITELAQLFNDMSILVEQQDETIHIIEDQAEAAQRDLETGVKHTEKAVDSARAARKKRLICFIICLIILLVVAAIVAVVIVTNNHKH